MNIQKQHPYIDLYLSGALSSDILSPDLSAPLTGTGWKGHRKDAEVHAPPINYLVWVRLQL